MSGFLPGRASPGGISPLPVRPRQLMAQLCLIAAALISWMLWRFPPQTTSFYPQCPIFHWLHVQCPGCGATRACAALLHGHVREALQYNTMTVAFMPGLLAFLGLSYWRATRPGIFCWPA